MSNYPLSPPYAGHTPFLSPHPQANVMLEYPIDEAVELLTRNLEVARTSLAQVLEDLDTVRDQCTTIEVGIPRHLHCLHSKSKRKRKMLIEL